MRWFMTMLLALALGAPVFAQDPDPKKDDPKKDEKKEEKKDEKKDFEEPPMTAAGQNLYDDVVRVYDEYYRILFDKTVNNEVYKADEVWDAAVKKAENAKYKDRTEFHDAITKMKAADRIFKKKVLDLINKKANDHAEKVNKWIEEKKGG
jgi:disulfide oxidoreductase YuzD